MPQKKYYAVKKGRMSGIFNSWDECKTSIEGYSGAEYKGFSNLEDAKRYLDTLDRTFQKDEDISCLPNVTNDLNEDQIAKAYVDGSFSEETGMYAYGCVILTVGKIERLSGIGKDENASLMRNVAGELTGAMRAIKWAYENKYKGIVIFHDYEGIAKWVTGEWKAKQEGTKKYISFVKKYKKVISINFQKVVAHTGDKYNEEADKLAKHALLNAHTEVINSTQNDIETKKYKNLFAALMKVRTSSKTQFYTKFAGYEISESKIQKFIKEVWKQEGKDINIIDSMKVYIDSQNCNIHWEIRDKDGGISAGEFDLKN